MEFNFLSSETKSASPAPQGSAKKGSLAPSLARRQKRDVNVRKEKRDMALKRRRVPTQDDGGVAGAFAENREQWSESEVIEAVNSLREVGSEKCLKGLRTLRSVLCGTDPPIQLALDRGCIGSLIQLLRVPDTTFKTETVWCLTNIASGTHDQTGQVLETVPDLLAIIVGEDKSLSEQACWAVGNIAGDSDEYRSTIVNNGAVLPLLKFLFDSVSGLGDGAGSNIMDESPVDGNEAAMMYAQTAAWSLSNLARGSTPASTFMETGMLPFLVSLIGHPNRTLAIEIWWIFTFLTAKEDGAVQQLLDMGLIKSMTVSAVSLDPGDISSIPLIRSMGNLSSGPEHWINSILEEPAMIDCLMKCSDQDTTNRAVLKETTWVLTNLLGGTERQRCLLLNAGILDTILALFYCDYFDVQREAIFAIRHACQTVEVLTRFVDSGAEDLLLQLIQFLRTPDEEGRVSSLEIISALVFASPETKHQVVKLCVNLDLLDTLEGFQYGPGGDGRLKHTINTLIGELDSFNDEDAASGDDADMDFNNDFTAAQNQGGPRSRGMDNKPSWMRP